MIGQKQWKSSVSIFLALMMVALGACAPSEPEVVSSSLSVSIETTRPDGSYQIMKLHGESERETLVGTVYTVDTDGVEVTDSVELGLSLAVLASLIETDASGRRFVKIADVELEVESAQTEGERFEAVLLSPDGSKTIYTIEGPVPKAIALAAVLLAGAIICAWTVTNLMDECAAKGLWWEWEAHLGFRMCSGRCLE